MDTLAGLRLFIRVVETGSFSKASAGLGITQPTATKHVAALEARLGARLFHRSTRGVTPTEVGAAYYGAPPGWIGREVAAQWDERVVRLVDPKTGALLREHKKKPRGWRQVHPSDASPCF